MRNRFQLLGVGSATTSKAGEVLQAWQAAHVSTAELTRVDTPEVRRALQKNLRHLRTHITVIERLLRAR